MELHRQKDPALQQSRRRREDLMTETSVFTAVDTTNGHGASPSARQPRRGHRGPSYQDSVERRAAMAVAMMRENGWSAKHTSSLLCVCPPYLSIARHLSDDDLQKLARGEIRLATLYRDYVRLQAERREQRQAAKREAQDQAARQAELETIHACLDEAGLTCLVDQIVARFSEAALVDCFDLVLERRGRDLVQAVINFVGADRVMRSLGQLATPHSVAAE
jgi:hypothetical protein